MRVGTRAPFQAGRETRGINPHPSEHHTLGMPLCSAGRPLDSPQTPNHQPTPHNLPEHSELLPSSVTAIAKLLQNGTARSGFVNQQLPSFQGLCWHGTGVAGGGIVGEFSLGGGCGCYVQPLQSACGFVASSLTSFSHATSANRRWLLWGEGAWKQSPRAPPCLSEMDVGWADENPLRKEGREVQSTEQPPLLCGAEGLQPLPSWHRERPWGPSGRS